MHPCSKCRRIIRSTKSAVEAAAGVWHHRSVEHGRVKHGRVKSAPYLLVLGAALLTAPYLPAQTPAPAPPPPPAKPVRPPALGDFSQSLEALAARVRPAVVQIFSTGYTAQDEGDGIRTGS